MNKKSIVILGGMGPSASSYLYNLLIDIAIKDYGAQNNDDFPDITLLSIPVPDFISDKMKRNKALKMLKDKMKKISNIDTLCACIACNTAHVLLPKLQAVSKVPFISMIDETVRQVYEDRKKKIGLLGTPSTIKYCLYQEPLNKYGVSTEIPSDKEIRILEKIIRHVIKGKVLKSDADRLRRIADGLQAKGAVAIILGCTELPLVFPKNYHLPIYNSLEILAKALLQTYYRQKKKVLKGGDFYDRRINT